MKKIVVVGFVALLALIAGFVFTQNVRAFGGGGYGNGYCPFGGQYAGSGYGMGPGMMGGYMMGPGMMGYGYGSRHQQPQRPLTEQDAKAIVESQLRGNPNLKLGKLKEESDSFEAEITTKDGSLVNKVLVDKNTGWTRSTY
jgi:hypothetical protein